MADVWTRILENLADRLTGPMSFRFFLQAGGGVRLRDRCRAAGRKARQTSLSLGRSDSAGPSRLAHQGSMDRYWQGVPRRGFAGSHLPDHRSGGVSGRGAHCRGPSCYRVLLSRRILFCAASSLSSQEFWQEAAMNETKLGLNDVLAPDRHAVGE
jgi:hypothetical protein